MTHMQNDPHTKVYPLILPFETGTIEYPALIIYTFFVKCINIQQGIEKDSLLNMIHFHVSDVDNDRLDLKLLNATSLIFWREEKMNECNVLIYFFSINHE